MQSPATKTFNLSRLGERNAAKVASQPSRVIYRNRPEGVSGKMTPKQSVGAGHDQNEAPGSRVEADAVLWFAPQAASVSRDMRGA